MMPNEERFISGGDPVISALQERYNHAMLSMELEGWDRERIAQALIGFTVQYAHDALKNFPMDYEEIIFAHVNAVAQYDR